MDRNEILDLISQMTLEEKASLTSGKNTFNLKGIERLNIPEATTGDGPHGLRKPIGDGIGMRGSQTATCFPTACALASSWDESLLRKTGEALANQAKAQGVHILLGPGTNIKRSPLCGRNFEYFSEDPLLSSTLATAYIKGVQDHGVGTSLKHFLANNQEYHRNTASSEIDERTLREIYLKSFEKAVIEGKPKTIMCSYNKINGIYASEQKRFLTDILRDEWGFEGAVVSDWGATHHRVKALVAGTDLTMPSATDTDIEIIEAVKNNKLEEKVLDQAVYRILKTIDDTKNEEIPTIDFEKDHILAKNAAIKSAILLKNDNDILPLKENTNVLFIGGFAEKPRYQGNGSSKVNSYKVSSITELIKDDRHVSYSEGFSIKHDKVDETLENDAIKKAKETDYIVVLAGMPDAFESEGFDRDHMRLPENQNHLIHSLLEVNKNVIVILHLGSPVEIPWVDKVPGILNMYLAGEAVSEATLDLIYGRVNPSGRLAESFPIKLEDNPSYLDFKGTHDLVRYSEGVFVGYRYYTTKTQPVNFPFGHGLSYSKFKYSHLKIDKKELTSKDHLTVVVDVTNESDIKAMEVVQLYVEAHTPKIRRPLRELRAFKKIDLNPKETKTVTFILDSSSFSYWHERANQFHIETGKYSIQINQSSNKVLLEEQIDLEGEWIRFEAYSELSVIEDVMKHPKGKAFLDQILPIVSGILKKMNYLGDDTYSDEEMVEKVKENKGLISQNMALLKQFLPHITKNEWDDLYKSLNE